ncbi:hypothetical protein SNEBB_001328, partial [Seison nebaliae]
NYMDNNSDSSTSGGDWYLNPSFYFSEIISLKDILRQKRLARSGQMSNCSLNKECPVISGEFVGNPQNLNSISNVTDDQSFVRELTSPQPLNPEEMSIIPRESTFSIKTVTTGIKTFFRSLTNVSKVPEESMKHKNKASRKFSGISVLKGTLIPKEVLFVSETVEIIVIYDICFVLTLKCLIILKRQNQPFIRSIEL